MGFLSEVRKIRNKEKEIRILFLGLDNAGKTTIVNLLANRDINKVEPTYGFNISTLLYRDYRLNIWDVGGQKSIRAYWKNHYEENDAIVWVVDSTDLHRMHEAALGFCGSLEEHRLSGAVLLVLANKQDLAGALSVSDVARELGLDQITDRKVLIQGCSARATYDALLASSSSATSTDEPEDIAAIITTYLGDLLSQVVKKRFSTQI